MVVFPNTYKRKEVVNFVETGRYLVGEYPVTGVLTSDYNIYRSFSSGPHGGVDIGDCAGDDVLAPAPGVVERIGETAETFTSGQGDETTFGTFVVLRHEEPEGPAYYSSYNHLAPNSIPDRVRPGWNVNLGEKLGVVGNTGFSKGAHLHWQVSRELDSTQSYANDYTVDPFDPDLISGSSRAHRIVRPVDERLNREAEEILANPRYRQRSNEQLNAKKLLINIPLPDNHNIYIDEKFRVLFNIQEGTDNPLPGVISIYNLSADSETYINSTASHFQLFAGYRELGLLLSSTVAKIERKWEPPDRITQIIMGGPYDTVARGIFHENYNGVEVRKILRDAATNMNLTLAPTDHIDSLDHTVYYIANKPAQEVVREICEYWELDFFYQGGILKLMPRHGRTDIAGESAVATITKDTGLIGTPSYVSQGNASTEGIRSLRFSTKLNSLLVPGAVVRVMSRSQDAGAIDATIQITKTKHTGDTWHDMFKTEVTGNLLDGTPTSSSTTSAIYNAEVAEAVADAN